MKLKLKEKSGSFELWAQGRFRAFVMVSNQEPGDSHRVAVELYSAVGHEAIVRATTVFNKLNQAMAIATR